jgi:membrane protease YdiL (CAAX protease family)
MTTQQMSAMQVETKTNPIRLSVFTWAVVLLVSDLPDAIWQAAFGDTPSWLFSVKIGLLMVVLVLSLIWKSIKVVRPYFFLLLVLMLALEGVSRLMGTASYNEWQNQAGWIAAMAGFQGLKMAVTAVMVAVLLLMGRHRKDFFFSLGELGIPVSAVNNKGLPRQHPIAWGQLGLILGVCIAPLTLLFFGLEDLPTADVLRKALPYFPLVLLFAATNAFSEETQFRASLLGDAGNIVGVGQAIWLTATFFGFAHYFGGSPSGIPGVLIAGSLGALFPDLPEDSF